MIDAIEKIEKYTEDLDYGDFEKETLRQDAVIREMEILGEAAKRVSNGIKSKYSDLPWQDAAGMRDKLIHGYFGVDVEIVWNTVKGDLADLKEELLEIEKREFS